MRGFYYSILLCCVFATPALTQLKTSDKGGHVTAIVDPNNQGLITIRRFPGTLLDPILSYPQKSFVSIMIEGRVYTNNHTGTDISTNPNFGGFLDNGVSKKIADTIRTTWANKGNCDVIQDVYPVMLGGSGQIVMRWKIKSNYPSTYALWGQGQFLLDLQVGQQNPNDGAPVLTLNGYRPVWDKYVADSASGIPSFFAAFEHQLPNAPSFTTGITGVGYTHDVNYQLGLKKPSQFTVGDWGSPVGTALVDMLWGVSGMAPWSSAFTDAAVHYQWEGVWIWGGTTVEVASTSYGTGEFTTCSGQLFGIVSYPRRFIWKPAGYDPDTATVEFFGFNVFSPLQSDPNFGPPSTQTQIKLHVGPNLRIVSPDTMRSPNQKIQLQQTAPNGLIPQYGVGVARWKIAVDKIPSDKNDSWIKFTAESSLSSNGPMFINSGDGDTCAHPVKVDRDDIPPVIKLDSSTRPYLRVNITEQNTYDLGIDSVWFVPRLFTDTSQFTIVKANSDGECPKSLHYEITQLDTNVGGCYSISARDCAGNVSSSHIYCFPAAKGGVEDGAFDRIELVGNPVSERTVLRIVVARSHGATIRVVDLTGRDVAVVSQVLLAGVNEIPIQVGGLSEGVYYIIAEWDGRQYAKKLSVIK